MKTRAHVTLQNILLYTYKSAIFVPLVGLVFPAIVMVSLSLHVQKNKIF